jgi:hypothetical protein
MPGIATGTPGAKAFDEMDEQKKVLLFRNQNDGKPQKKNIVIEPESSQEFRTNVLRALGVGKIITEKT